MSTKIRKRDLLRRIEDLEQANRLGISVDELSIKKIRPEGHSFEVGDKFILAEDHTNPKLTTGTILTVRFINEDGEVSFEDGWCGRIASSRVFLGGLKNPLEKVYVERG